jgi:hypothetical protein
MIISKFIRFDHQEWWCTAAVVDHGGWNLTSWATVIRV